MIVYRYDPWMVLYEKCSNGFSLLNKMAARGEIIKTFKYHLFHILLVDFDETVQQ
jgi:hypothetical protein